MSLSRLGYIVTVHLHVPFLAHCLVSASVRSLFRFFAVLDCNILMDVQSMFHKRVFSGEERFTSVTPKSQFVIGHLDVSP